MALDRSRPRQPTITQMMGHVRVTTAVLFAGSYAFLIVAVPALIVFMLCILGGLFKGETIDRLALVCSLQVGLGMYLGFISLFFGVLMTWIGIDAAFEFGGTAGPENSRVAKIALSSASPGLLIAVGGLIVVVASLYKTIEFETTSPAHSRPHPGHGPISPYLNGAPHRVEDDPAFKTPIPDSGDCATPPTESAADAAREPGAHAD
jgi:hypothetical protein